MAYNYNIPQSTDKFKNSYAQLQGNFQSINTALLGVDNGGILCTNQATDPATSATQMALYSRIAQNTVQPGAFANTLCVRKNTSGNVYEFTGGAANNPGWTRLPSGMLIKWMPVTIPAELADTFATFNQTWPTATGGYNIPAFTSAPTYFNLMPVATTVTSPTYANPYLVSGSPTTTTYTIKVNSYNYGILFIEGWESFNINVIAFGQG